MIRNYYRLTKPGIIYANALVAAAGFIYASHNGIDWKLFLYMLFGLSFVIASACVFNNYYDRDIDKRMKRTQNRALVSGAISLQNAVVFATALGIAGAILLYFFTTLPAFIVAVAGWAIYVFAYTPLKHVSPQALWVGAIAGATPPVVGYAAVTNTLDINAFLLFLFLCVWQIPHFLGIAAFRFNEYKEANIKLLIKKEPSAQGKRTGRIVFYLSLVVLLAWCGALMLHK